MDAIQELLDNLHTYKINEVRERFHALTIKNAKVTSDREDNHYSEMMNRFIRQCIRDDRKGIKDIAKKYLLEKEKLIIEKKRTEELYKWEKELWERGVVTIVGIDEVGRGCLAGPVVAAAVILPWQPTILYLNDSKKLSSEQRKQRAIEIKAEAIDYGIGEVDAERIDQIGIVNATFEAMKYAVSQLDFTPNHILVDAFKIPGLSISQTNIIGGDRLSASIAAASIIAKVYRDEKMIEYSKVYPDFGFENHKGYGTKEHLNSIENFGITSLHRMTFLTRILSMM